MGDISARMGENTVVKLQCKQGWMSVDEAIRAEGGEP